MLWWGRHRGSRLTGGPATQTVTGGVGVREDALKKGASIGRPAGWANASLENGDGEGRLFQADELQLKWEPEAKGDQNGLMWVERTVPEGSGCNWGRSRVGRWGVLQLPNAVALSSSQLRPLSPAGQVTCPESHSAGGSPETGSNIYFIPNTELSLCYSLISFLFWESLIKICMQINNVSISNRLLFSILTQKSLHPLRMKQTEVY